MLRRTFLKALAAIPVVGKMALPCQHDFSIGTWVCLKCGQPKDKFVMMMPRKTGMSTMPETLALWEE